MRKGLYCLVGRKVILTDYLWVSSELGKTLGEAVIWPGKMMEFHPQCDAESFTPPSTYFVTLHHAPAVTAGWAFLETQETLLLPPVFSTPL